MRSKNPQILEVKFHFFEIFKFNFFELGVWDFPKILGNRRGAHALSTQKFLGKSMSQIEVTDKFSKKIWGALPPRGYPASAQN